MISSVRFAAVQRPVFAGVSAFDNLKKAVLDKAANGSLAERKALTDTAIDLYETEVAAAALPGMFVQQLKDKGYASLAQQAENANLTSRQLCELLEDLILDRAKNETDPAIRAMADELVFSINARRLLG